MSYRKYKSSGVEWIGEVPEHWDSIKLKYIAKINPSISYSRLDNHEGDDVVFLPMEKVSENGDIKQDSRKNLDRLHSGFTYFEKNDVIVAKITPCFENGKGALLDDLETEFGFGSTEFHTLRSNGQITPKFLFYVTRTRIFMTTGEASMTGSAGQKRVPTSFVENYVTALPPEDEQFAITEYLDDKTAQIDKLIAHKQKLIELLKEERTAIINHAVTKGIAHVETQDFASLRPSGIEWLGDIPAHWNLVPMTKYLESIIDYRGKTPTKSGMGIFLVTARNIKNGVINYSLSEEYVLEEEYVMTMRRGKLEVGDVLFTTEAPLGEAANVDRTDVAVAQRIVKFRGKKKLLNNYYLKHWIMSPMFQQDLYTYATGSTALGIKGSKLFNLKLLLPPLSEQILIITFVEEQTNKFNATISRIEKEINLLQEYRTALISEVVTGKVKVV